MTNEEEIERLEKALKEPNTAARQGAIRDELNALLAESKPVEEPKPVPSKKKKASKKAKK
jgi:hypothetical protein